MTSPLLHYSAFLNMLLASEPTIILPWKPWALVPHFLTVTSAFQTLSLTATWVHLPVSQLPHFSSSLLALPGCISFPVWTRFTHFNRSSGHMSKLDCYSNLPPVPSSLWIFFIKFIFHIVCIDSCRSQIWPEESSHIGMWSFWPDPRVAYPGQPQQGRCPPTNDLVHSQGSAHWFSRGGGKNSEHPHWASHAHPHICILSPGTSIRALAYMLSPMTQNFLFLPFLLYLPPAPGP